jgi:hypothetical protein
VNERAPVTYVELFGPVSAPVLGAITTGILVLVAVWEMVSLRQGAAETNG